MPYAAAIAAAGSLLSGLLSNKAAQEAQQRSIAAQRGLQNMLLNSGGQIARSAKQAGLSPAFALGNSSVPAASAPASNFSPYDLSPAMSLIGSVAQRKLQKQQEKVAQAQEKETSANAEIAEEKAKQEKINTQNMQARSNEFNRNNQYIDPYNGQIIEDVDAWTATHPGILPEVSVSVGNEGRLQAIQQKEEYETLSKEREGRLHEVDTQNVERSNRMSQARYNQAISDARRNSRSIMHAIVNMPEKEYDSLVKKIETQGLENAYQSLFNKQFEESSFGRMIDNINSAGSFGDKLLMVLTWIANNVSMSARIK